MTDSHRTFPGKEGIPPTSWNEAVWFGSTASLDSSTFGCTHLHTDSHQQRFYRWWCPLWEIAIRRESSGHTQVLAQIPISYLRRFNFWVTYLETTLIIDEMLLFFCLVQLIAWVMGGCFCKEKNCHSDIQVESDSDVMLTENSWKKADIPDMIMRTHTQQILLQVIPVNTK